MREKSKKIISTITSILFILIIIAIFVAVYKIYKLNYFGDFEKAEYISNITKFTRDDEIKYSKDYSYKIESSDFNDAMVSKKIQVEKNTSYKVTCMVKTDNVVAEKDVSNSGAQICLANTVYSSRSVTGTSDWQKLEFIFNSRNNDSVEIGFRLGGNQENCKGTAWFSDIKLEKGVASTDSEWNMVCFICKNIDVVIEQDDIEKQLKFSMSDEDIKSMKDNMERLQNSIYSLSGEKMSIKYEIIEIDEPITSVSYDPEHGYYINPVNVKNLIDSYIKNTEYDHIFIAVRLGDMTSEIPVYDWIGLGGMDYYGIGFSNIRLPNDTRKSYAYKYNPNINTFPEEVFLHEFLHTLERNLIEYGIEIPALHDNEIYGYNNKALIGLKDWYEAYMKKRIWDYNKEGYVGLDEIVYTLKPSHESDFVNAQEIEFANEPKNILDDIKNIGESIGTSVSNLVRAAVNK